MEHLGNNWVRKLFIPKIMFFSYNSNWLKVHQGNNQIVHFKLKKRISSL